VAYDAHLAARVREQLADNPGVHEQAMFGGLAFLVAGRLAVAASGQGGLLVRVDPARVDRLLATGTAQPMQMKGRAVQGWLHIDSDHLRTKRQLAEWIAIGTTTAESIPARRRLTTQTTASRNRHASDRGGLESQTVAGEGPSANPNTLRCADISATSAFLTLGSSLAEAGSMEVLVPLGWSHNP
jgi:TfoX/Sxy family transcriptional regulator of competence genes